MQVDRYPIWLSLLMGDVNTRVYKYIQFTTRENELDCGGSIMNLVCDKVGIPKEYQDDFWIDAGVKCFKAALKKRDQQLHLR